MTGKPGDTRCLVDRISRAPVIHDGARVERFRVDVAALAESNTQLQALCATSTMPWALLDGIASASSFLTELMLRRPQRIVDFLAAVPEAMFARLEADLAAAMADAPSIETAMRLLRGFKADVALLTALTDLGGVFDVTAVTRALSDAADVATRTSVDLLFRLSAQRGDWLDIASGAAERSGYFVLAMGKHGARALNYSSDIDLIVFYDEPKARLRQPLETQTFFVRLTRDLVRLLHERTGDGYVFRTDLRLRPDAGATPIALSVNAALSYYESFGQNWERAAMIKARVVAGDGTSGTRFLKELEPYIWRKYLDFAAIADIHAMKRQIHAVKGFGTIGVAGHNIKLGRGGIREIEFFVQTQQLIAGGRQADLRAPETRVALEQLVVRGWIKPQVALELSAAYAELRRIEHALQMIGDEQTQTLPETPDTLQRLANFAGFATTEAFRQHLIPILETVERHYAQLFETSPTLTTAAGANLMFAGAADDPATVSTLSLMGFSDPKQVIATIRGWHHGRYPAVRTPRAREGLTDVQPRLVEALAKTPEPQRAFFAFDRLLAQLPSSVQLFALLKQNPRLLDLVAEIVGTAPRLARVLGARRRVLDAVLDPRFFGEVPTTEALEALVNDEIASSGGFEASLDRARVVGHEQAFLLGVRVLTGTIGAAQAGPAYARLADTLIAAMTREVATEMTRVHGTVPGGGVAVAALGKLGGREMTAASDLDLMVIYEFDAAVLTSDGKQPLVPMAYYTRFTQRLIAALSAPTAEGSLYDIDFRLRPSGQKGPLATQLSSFIAYQANDAWTWEHMALTRARVVAGDPPTRRKVLAAIATTLTKARDRQKIAQDVQDMRQRITADKGTTNVWDLKQVRGGLVDIEFIAQFGQLVAAHGTPSVCQTQTGAALEQLAETGALSRADADDLIGTWRLISNLTQVLRLCLDGPFDPQTAPAALIRLLANAGEAPDFATLEQDLIVRLNRVHNAFNRVIR